METFDNKIYLTDKEAATRYGFSDSWFQKRRSKKYKGDKPPFIRLSRKIYYDQSILDEWFKKQRKMIY